ncbi:MAG: ribosome biogenesis GTP-binding protein YihA/YsxC [bacterium]
MRVTTAEFVQSSPGLDSCPADDVPEFAFIGRSNVGKSSLLNLLTGKQGLARVSQTPGCTQLINFFKINGAFRMVDLPGYGYAKVPKGHRVAFQDIIAGYIADRPNLRRVFVLVDSRHEPQKIDLEFLEWLGEVDRPFAVVFTKTDKLKPSHVKKNTEAFLEVLAAVHAGTPDVFLTSSKTRDGKREILGSIGALLDAAA